MAGQEKKKRLALDTNILFDLAAGEDFAHDFIGVFIEKGYVFSVPPTVVQELSAFAWMMVEFAAVIAQACARDAHL